MMSVAPNVLAKDHALADLIETINKYYQYDCDRTRFPFKSFARWIRYDLARWMFRAIDDNDYRRAAIAARVPDASTRKRETLNSRVRRQVKELDELQ